MFHFNPPELRDEPLKDFRCSPWMISEKRMAHDALYTREMDLSQDLKECKTPDSELNRRTERRCYFLYIFTDFRLLLLYRLYVHGRSHRGSSLSSLQPSDINQIYSHLYESAWLWGKRNGRRDITYTCLVSKMKGTEALKCHFSS